MVGIEAHAVLIQVSLVKGAVYDPLIADGQGQSGVAAGEDGNPLVGQGLGGLVQPWVDDDDLPAVFAAHLQEVTMVATLVGHPVVAVHHMQLAFAHLQVMGAVGGAVAAHHVGVGDGPGAEGHGTGHVVDGATELVDDILQRVNAEAVARAAGQQGALAVLVEVLLQLVGDVLQGLIPGDALPLVLAAKLPVGIVGGPVLALHGILDVARRGHLLKHGIAARAGATLRVGQRVLFHVGADLQRNAVLHVDADEAAGGAAAAIVLAGSGQPLAGLNERVRVRRSGCRRGLGRGLRVLAASSEAGEACDTCCSSTPLQEITSCQFHRFPLLSVAVGRRAVRHFLLPCV